MNSTGRAWSWIPTLYFAEGLPYVIVTAVSVVMYKRLGLNDEEIALYTSWLYLPWVIKPFWSTIVDALNTNRFWILLMEVLMGFSMAGIAFTLNTAHYIQWSLCFFWLLAFNSATHDIAADGYYMSALDPHQQAVFVGIRSTFYRIAQIAGSGLLIMGAGFLEAYTRNPVRAWSITFLAAGLLLVGLAMLHKFTVRKVAADENSHRISQKQKWANTGRAFGRFFMKKHIVLALLFMLLYRLPEALLVKICPLFLLSQTAEGGLGLSTSQVGLAQGTLGVIGLVVGGILGGVIASILGWKRSLWPMVCAITLPNIFYVILAYYQPDNLWFLSTCIFIEQFGYGFGFTAYMLFLLWFAQGQHATSHYALCTGFMALGMMIPGLFAGWIEMELLGGSYLNFFILVMFLVPITFLVAGLAPVEDDFGKKAKA